MIGKIFIPSNGYAIFGSTNFLQSNDVFKLLILCLLMNPWVEPIKMTNKMKYFFVE